MNNKLKCSALMVLLLGSGSISFGSEVSYLKVNDSIKNYRTVNYTKPAVQKETFNSSLRNNINTKIASISSGLTMVDGSITNEIKGENGKKGFTNSGIVNAKNFTNKNGGTVENKGSGQLNLSGEFKNGETKDGSTFDNSGTITAKGDITNNGTFNNSKTDGVGSVTGNNLKNNGTFTNTDGSVTANSDLTNNGKFENKGTGTVAVEGNLKNEKDSSGGDDSGTFTNENTVTVNGNDGVTNSGKFSNSNDGKLTVQNGGSQIIPAEMLKITVK